MTSSPSVAADAVRNAHEWFEVNSGWAPPDDETLAEWVSDGVCRCPDDCLVAPEAWCEHGLASWALILAALDDTDHTAVADDTHDADTDDDADTGVTDNADGNDEAVQATEPEA